MSVSFKPSLRIIVVLGCLMVQQRALAQDAGVPEADDGPPEAPPQQNEADNISEVAAHDVPTDAERLQRSADAVHVIELRREQGHAADLGEVLARAQGIAVLRDGGLGSGMRFSLNGLYDDQIRFFLDEVPLALAGYALDIVNVPVNLIERVEVYRGVVPIRFGADALGGAVNLVTDRSYRNDAGLSYQVGSFGTHRLTLHGRYRHEPSGFVVGGEAFFDRADNDYDVDVEIPDQRGQPRPARVPRFHDAYQAFGGSVEAGVVDRPWAKHFLVKGFVSSFDKELQHNLVMRVPYGEVEYGRSVYGATARYAVALRHDLELDLVASYAHQVFEFNDQAQWVYDWHGARVRPRPVRGETSNRPIDLQLSQDGVFGRALARWTLSEQHQLRASISPQYASRSAEAPAAFGPDLLVVVSGIEYELSLLDRKLTNILFVKDYIYRSSSFQRTTAGDAERTVDQHSIGFGDALRVQIAEFLSVKASYEFATRLPTVAEVFGDGALIVANLDLRPEVSHNINFGPRLELQRTRLGDFTLDVNLFMRESDRLIAALGDDRYIQYQNLVSARALGIENAVAWSSARRLLTLGGTLTWQNQVSTTNTGPFETFEGDRIPNRPYLFASWLARLRFAVPDPRAALEPYYYARFVEEYRRGWESQGLRAFAQMVPSQLTHNLGVTWTLLHDLGTLTVSFEVSNLTDAKVFDTFGVQRPGRAYYAKLVAEL